MNNQENTIAAENELSKLIVNAGQTLQAFVTLGQSFSLQLDYSMESLDETETLLLTFKTKL